jgi:dihydrofolate reductase
MRKVVISVYTTLDGVMEDPSWSGQFWNEEHGKFARDLLFASDALLMGRNTYEGFAASWPIRTAADDAPGAPGFVDRINSMPKFVASTTLHEPLAWANSHLLTQPVAEAVATLKQQPGQDLLMYDAGQLAHTLMLHNLVDELHLWVYPLVVGNGGRLFGGANDVPALKLVNTRPFSSGVVLLTYHPEKKA